MNNSNDNEFDNKIIESMSQYLPQHNMISKINPWERPIHQITLGMILTTITFKMFYLDYILPTLGIVIMYLGFRALKNVNNSFRLTWKLSMLRLAINFIIYTFILATPLHLKLQNYILITNIMNFILQLLILFIFRKSLNLVFFEEKVHHTKDPLLCMCILQIILFFLGFISHGNSYFVFTIISLGFVICYFFLFKQLYNISQCIKSVGYSLVNAPVKIRYEIFICGYMSLYFIFILIFSTFSYHINLPSQILKPIDNFTARTELINKGFPPEIINDISDNNIQLLRTATKITTSVDNVSFSQNSQSDCTLQCTTVATQTADSCLYFLVYFKWENSVAYWNDGFRMDSEWNLQLIDGILLYDSEDKSYTAPIPRLNNNLHEYNDIFGYHDKNLISGGVSYPFNSSNQRGYVFYKVQAPENATLASNYFNYFHYSSPLRYPYALPENDYSLISVHKRCEVAQFHIKDTNLQGNPVN